jgi:hypothetical protein
MTIKTPEVTTEPIVETQQVEAPTPTVQPPVTTPTKPEVSSNFLLSQLHQAEKDRADKLERELQELRNRPAPVVEKTPEELRKEFYENPGDVIKRYVQQTVEPLIAPVSKYAQQVQTRDALSEAKASVAALYPDFKKYEPYIDQLAQQTKAEPTAANLRALYFTVRGAHAAGELKIDEPVAPTTPVVTQQPPIVNTPTPVTPNSPVVTPPHLRPSPSTPASMTNQPKLRELTETEERLRRENKLTHEKFLELVDAPPQVEGWVTKEKK